ncbi:MAG TPA: acyl-CoA dehydrogenase family protein, partial [Pyrinomonadaceae bacterium]|nr:acyl-CoA dehydrogenase family protein [Pyrinomonadaceae bacterium]
ESGEWGEEEAQLLRLLTPVMKLTTGKQAVVVTSEVLECFGGAGYVEDTGLPVLLRDSQVLPIWEGTTNVLALDTLRALGSGDHALGVLMKEAGHWLDEVVDSRLVAAIRTTRTALDHAQGWLLKARKEGLPSLEVGARRFAMTLGRATESALLISQAQWSLDHKTDARALSSARRFAQAGLDLISDDSLEELPFREL